MARSSSTTAAEGSSMQQADANHDLEHDFQDNCCMEEGEKEEDFIEEREASEKSRNRQGYICKTVVWRYAFNANEEEDKPLAIQSVYARLDEEILLFVLYTQTLLETGRKVFSVNSFVSSWLVGANIVGLVLLDVP